MQDFGFKNLKVFQMSYEAAMDIFQLFGYLKIGDYGFYDKKNMEIGQMRGGMVRNPAGFLPK